MGPENDSLTDILIYLSEKQVPELSRILKYLAKVERRAGKTASQHLGFGAITKQLETRENSIGIYYGELNTERKPDGVGI